LRRIDDGRLRVPSAVFGAQIERCTVVIVGGEASRSIRGWLVLECTRTAAGNYKFIKHNQSVVRDLAGERVAQQWHEEHWSD
jgi:hypothetical protein